MSHTRSITRFIAYFPNAGDGGREELARTSDLLRRSEFHLLRRDAYLLGVMAPTSTAPPQPADWLLDVFPGTAASARLAAADFNAAESLEDIHRKAEASAQCYNVLQPAQSDFLLESDALGLKPVYTARTPNGSLLGSRIADLLRLFPALAEATDTTALYELLGFWGPLMGRTLHQRIHRTLPGGRYRWTPTAGLSGERVRDLRPVTVEPMWFTDRAIETIRDAAGQSLLEKTKGAAQPILLALSGGFDSRFVAALCCDHHVQVRAASYGGHHLRETRTARAIARTLRIELQVLSQLRDGTLRYLPQYLDAVEGTADPCAASIMNLCRASSKVGTSLLYGYPGDTQGGGHISDLKADDYASRESVAEAVTRYYYPPSRPDLCGLFSPAANLDDVRQDVLSGLRSDCSPYQAYRLWYLENRNRRHEASHFSMLGEHFDPILPFYDRRLFDIWRSIPPVGVTHRALTKTLLAHYYPKLARIPHPEEPAPVTPNLRWQLDRFYHGLPERLLSAGVGAERAEEIQLRLYRHRNFRTLSKLEAPQQRAFLLAELSRLRPALKEGLGLELSPGYAAVLSSDLQALRSMYGVAHYAQRRIGTDQPAVIKAAPTDANRMMAGVAPG